MRPMVRPWSPIWVVAAMATSSIRSGGSGGLRRSSSRMHLMTRSSARVSAYMAVAGLAERGADAVDEDDVAARVRGTGPPLEGRRRSGRSDAARVARGRCYSRVTKMPPTGPGDALRSAAGRQPSASGGPATAATMTRRDAARPATAGAEPRQRRRDRVRGRRVGRRSRATGGARPGRQEVLDRHGLLGRAVGQAGPRRRASRARRPGRARPSRAAAAARRRAAWAAGSSSSGRAWARRSRQPDRWQSRRAARRRSPAAPQLGRGFGRAWRPRRSPASGSTRPGRGVAPLGDAGRGRTTAPDQGRGRARSRTRCMPEVRRHGSTRGRRPLDAEQARRTPRAAHSGLPCDGQLGGERVAQLDQHLDVERGVAQPGLGQRPGRPVGGGVVLRQREPEECSTTAPRPDPRQAGQPRRRARCRRADAGAARARPGRAGPGWRRAGPTRRRRAPRRRGPRSGQAIGSMSQVPEPSRRSWTR